MKHYEKPQIFMEDFTMAEHIAKCGFNHADHSWAGISDVKGNLYEGNCTIEFNDNGYHAVIFAPAMEMCIDKAGHNEQYDIFCYQGQQELDLQVYGS